MKKLEAAIFDMDGVITDTAKLHCDSWTLMFNEFLKSYSVTHHLIFRPFTEQDYLYYVDGITRHDGVKSFLASRNITLPEGSPNDAPSKLTVYGLGNRKDGLFHRLLEQQGIELFPSTVHFIMQLRRQGIKTAVISSSKNGQAIIKKAGLEPLFDTMVDGNALERKHLPGKPHPAIFLEAAKQLKVKPKNAMVIEDALSGVQAGRAGNFGLVLGIDRKCLGTIVFMEYGADIVVTDMKEFTLNNLERWFANKLGNVFSKVGQVNRKLMRRLAKKTLMLFFDYDGTLTPIVDRPEQAVLSIKIQNYLLHLSQYYKIAVISGRQLNDLRAKVGLANLYYAGNHGLEISGPQLTHNEGAAWQSEIAKVYHKLMQHLAHIPGILLENKIYSLSVHYRLVPAQYLVQIKRSVNEILQAHPKLFQRKGKKVFEICPTIPWHKGRAVLWLLDSLYREQAVLPLYFGDDITDEDAFRALKAKGIGIIVSRKKRFTAARYRLRNVAELEQFLALLCEK